MAWKKKQPEVDAPVVQTASVEPVPDESAVPELDPPFKVTAGVNYSTDGGQVKPI